MLEKIRPPLNVSDFIDGQRDCREGKEHIEGKSESYDRGYMNQYHLEQLKDWRSARGY